MGLRHSGELTDAALSSLAELHCASRHDVQRASGISHYSRYRDNVLILAEDKNCCSCSWGFCSNKLIFSSSLWNIWSMTTCII